MNILHLTDFHYQSNGKHKLDQTKLLSALEKKIQEDPDIDFIIFSGDLVQSGANEIEFLEAEQLLLNGIASACKVPIKNVFICGGNHDNHLGQELTPITEAVSKINNNSDMDKFMKEHEGASFKLSLANQKNYIEFQNLFYSQHKEASDQISDLYTVHHRAFGKKKIAIVSFNSAWRAFDSKTDRDNLLYPISILKEAISKIDGDTDFKIALLHHPISDFKGWNAMEIENLIHTEFHMLFSGHVHQRKHSLHICVDEGIFCCFSPATLSIDNHSSMGYSIINVDLDNYDLEIHQRKYDRSENYFYELPIKKDVSIPVNSIKSEQNTFRKKLRQKHADVLSRANELFVSNYEQSANRGFLELFTEPILKSKSRTQIAEQKFDTERKSLEEISHSVADNYIIYGKDKTGKTSILYKVQLDLLSDLTSNKVLPVYIDYKEYRASGKKMNVYDIISAFYSQNQRNSEGFGDKFHLKLLIDNYDPSIETLNEQISSFLAKFPKTTFIACIEETLSNSFDNFSFDGRTYKNLFIQEISKKEVRTLTNKWPNLTEEKRELILDKIFKVLNQLNIPASYWTVSLFIWVFEKNNEANVRNNFELIQFYIDDLLDKEQFLKEKKIKIEFEDFKAYLAYLAHYLVKIHHEQGYEATYTEVVNVTERYIKDNKRFVVTVEQILEILLNKGILRKSVNNSYTFRLTGVFEFFIALFMKDNEGFRNEVINDDHFYLSFSNELELCAGFNRKDSEYVTKIFEKTQTIFAELNNDYKGSVIDLVLQNKIAYGLETSIKQLTNDFKTVALSTDVQDEIASGINDTKASEQKVAKKKYYEKIERISAHLEKSLFILSRVFRNSSLKDDKLDDDILNFILDSACHLGFQLLDEVKKGEDQKLDESREKLMVRLMSTFMPLIVQNFLFDALAQSNLERILLDKINQLKGDSKNNQFKLMLLYFTLIDLDLKNNKKYIDDVMETMKMGLLKQTSLIKLYSYLMFRCTPNSPLEIFLKNRIQEYTLKLNHNAKAGNIQRELSRLTQGKNPNG